MSPPHETTRAIAGGPTVPAREVRPVLLDSRQWSYVRRRYELTPRELQIAELVCRGFRNDRIARDSADPSGDGQDARQEHLPHGEGQEQDRDALQFVNEASSPAGLQSPLPHAIPRLSRASGP
jgi:hypothetical protein